jgi:hypothetical protein
MRTERPEKNYKKLLVLSVSADYNFHPVISNHSKEKGMVKTILKVLGGLVAFILVLIIAASVAIMFIVNKGMIEDQMKKALNRHVQI